MPGARLQDSSCNVATCRCLRAARAACVVCSFCCWLCNCAYLLPSAGVLQEVTIRRRPPHGVEAQNCGPVDFKVPLGGERRPTQTSCSSVGSAGMQGRTERLETVCLPAGAGRQNAPAARWPPSVLWAPAAAREKTCVVRPAVRCCAERSPRLPPWLRPCRYGGGEQAAQHPGGDCVAQGGGDWPLAVRAGRATACKFAACCGGDRPLAVRAGRGTSCSPATAFGGRCCRMQVRCMLSH